MLIETGVPLNLFFLGYSGNQEVSWHHLNQISNPTVHNITITVTGLENLLSNMGRQRKERRSYRILLQDGCIILQRIDSTQ